VYPDAGCGCVHLYHLHSATEEDHFYTTSATERDNASGNWGSASEGITAYVL
ncbi:hypothetical protein BDZ97DRAFT_1645515, partial [Flammula alnicola]